jgi:DNA polymerase
MSSKSIIDDIYEVLESQRKSETYAYVSERNAREFFAPRRKFAPETSLPESSPAHAVADLTTCTLDELRLIAGSCTVCALCENRKNAVFGEGNPDAELMFIGEFPSEEDDIQGRPFAGEDGVLLTKMISAMQFDRQEVFICNVVKCHPPGKRNPSPEEAAACMPYLKRQIELVKPKVIVLLGAMPLQCLLGQRGISRFRGQWQEYNGIPVMPTFHPAYLLRFEAEKKPAWQDLQKVMKVFGKIHSK